MNKTLTNNLDRSPLSFGKFKGQTPEEIAEEDPGYIVWMYENIKPKRCSKDLAVACEQDNRSHEEEIYKDIHF